MKTFFIWLFTQAVFARVLFGIAIEFWFRVKATPDLLSYFLAPVVIIILAETVASAFVVYPLVRGSVQYQTSRSY